MFCSPVVATPTMPRHPASCSSTPSPPTAAYVYPRVFVLSSDLSHKKDTPSPGGLTMGDDAVCLQIPIPCIEITPSAGGNFVDFNRAAEDLDSEWLMQPVNEAEYDSETQFCVDVRANAQASYYDHYTTRRKKKKRRVQKHVDACGGSDDSEGDAAAAAPGVHLAAPGAASSTEEKEKARLQQMHDALPKRAHAVPVLEVAPPLETKKDHLQLPGMAAPASGALSNRACRRLACGSLPPELRHKPANPVITAAAYDAAAPAVAGPAALPPPPSYEEAVHQRQSGSPDRAHREQRHASFSSRGHGSPTRE
eukprot:TRINITY_DN123_c0_g1_i3.p1 TRINITY_DN123_c0_g1~~TRINITY_DN123_c0_g1_i3.p1  ORF type:complete len:309 (+),score=92.54 TRINITY_DN123_c0_g1_i3:1382-2308(+)